MASQNSNKRMNCELGVLGLYYLFIELLLYLITKGDLNF